MNKKHEGVSAISPRTPYQVMVDTKCGAAPIYDAAGVAKFDLRPDNEAARPADGPKGILLDEIAERLFKFGLPRQVAALAAESLCEILSRSKSESAAAFADVAADASDEVWRTALIQRFIDGVGRSTSRANLGNPLVSDSLCVPIFRLATCRPSEIAYSIEDVARLYGISAPAVRAAVDWMNTEYGVPRPGALPPATRKRISQVKIYRNRAAGIVPKPRQRSERPPGRPKKWNFELVQRVAGAETLLPGIIVERLIGTGLGRRTAWRALSETIEAGGFVETEKGLRSAGKVAEVPAHG